MSDKKYITAEKAKELTNGYEHKLNFTLVDIVYDNGDYAEQVEPGKWIVAYNYFTPTVFLKVEKDMTLTEYYVKEDET